MDTNRDFMSFFGPGLMAARVKEAAPALADRIEKKLRAARAGLREQTDAAIDKMLDEEIAGYVQQLAESEVALLKDQVRDLLRERLTDRPASQGLKSAREASPAVRALLEQSRSVTAARALLSGVSRKSSKPAALVYPPKPRGWGRRTK